MEKMFAEGSIGGDSPVGRMLAIALAEKGHRVLVVERQKNPYPLPRAVCMDHEIFRAIHAHGGAHDVEALALNAAVRPEPPNPCSWLSDPPRPRIEENNLAAARDGLG